MMHGDATREMVFPVRWFVDTTFMCNYLKVLKRLFMLPTCELVVMIVMHACVGKNENVVTQQMPHVP